MGRAENLEDESGDLCDDCGLPVWGKSAMTPLPVVDITTTYKTWSYWACALIDTVKTFKPIQGRGLRIRIDIVDTRELEAAADNYE